VIGVTLDHRLHGQGDFETAAADVAAAAGQARADPRVDPGRLALWFFSGGGPLLADWLREPPGWLRCVAATYPRLAATPDAASTRGSGQRRRWPAVRTCRSC
jgi:dienelactone hydrolase